MRRSSIATALVVLTAGLTATALRRMATRRRAAVPAAAVAAPTAPAAVVPAEEVAAPDAVVLPFTRPAAPAPAAPAAPARCGDSGGLTRAGAPCASRATSAGRCHHHRIAAEPAA